ncbi:MAG: MDR family MFS transporter [Microbacterium sp.]
MPDGVTTTAVGLRSERGPVLLALMVSTGLIAIDATVLATAVSTVSADLGGYSQFPWLFSAYLLAQAVTVPVYSKLADTFGRKPLMLLGIGLFLVGSVLCGLAWSMPALIAFRVVQGLGAGAVMPMAITIAGDIYTVAERATAQGYIASVWAMASVVGPLLGGVFAQWDAWRWIFFINVPLCVVAGWLIVRDFDESALRAAPRRRHRIDVAGAILVTAGSALAILGVLEGGVSWPWLSLPSAVVFGVALVLLAAFVLVERRAAEPILPLGVLSRRLIWSTSAISLSVGAGLIGLTSFMPSYLQYGAGVTPLVAGFAVAALTLGWPISASLSGRFLYLPLGFRPTVQIGTAIAIVGMVVLTVLGPHPTVIGATIGCLVVGFGFGLIASPSLIAAQSSVAWEERAVVTGANMFARSIGSSVGAAVYGAISTAALRGRSQTDPVAIAEAGTAVMIAVLVTVAAIGVFSLAMPRVRAEDAHVPATVAAEV